MFCEETQRFACQSGPRVLAKMARPARQPTVVGLAVALEALGADGTYRRAARQVAARPRGRSAEPAMSPMRCRTHSCASSVRRSQRGGEQAWERPGRLRRGMRRGMGIYAPRMHWLRWTHDVPRWTVCGLLLCPLVVHGFVLLKVIIPESIVLASSAASVDVSVYELVLTYTRYRSTWRTRLASLATTFSLLPD